MSRRKNPEAQARQGDVFLRRVQALPAGAEPLPRDRGRVVLAYGEATGHAHAIAAAGATLYGDELNRRFLQVLDEGGVQLLHEEHGTITLEPGVYEVVGQREYSPDAVRRVAD